jgi:hypothetical protein
MPSLWNMLAWNTLAENMLAWNMLAWNNACLEYAGYNWSCRNDLRYMYYYPDIQRRETRFRQYGM